jgi:hypothetical protein
MPQPFTVRDWDSGLPVATFDQAGNLNLAGTVTTGGLPSRDGTTVLPGTPAVTGSSLSPWQFPAGPPSGGDDTPAIQAAVNAAVTYAQNNHGYAEVICQASVYQLNSPTAKSSANKGNAQVWLPVIGTGAQKITLVIRSTRSSAALPYYVPSGGAAQLGGCVWLSSLTGQAVDGTWGAPSILGGPTPEQGYGSNSGSNYLFSNMNVVIDGIAFVAALNPTISGMDFRGVYEMEVLSAAALCNASAWTMSQTTPSSSWTAGLYGPQNLNGDNVLVGSYSCEGFYYGAAFGEHLTCQRYTAVYCIHGIWLQADGKGEHGWEIDYASIEACDDAIDADGTSTTARALRVGLLDTESLGWYHAPNAYHVNDATNSLGGHILVHDSGGPSVIKASGAANLELIAGSQARGLVTPPSVPASGTALASPFWRHATVYIAGTMTGAVKINGTTTGSSAAGAYRVPSGATITLTYSSAPTWVWVLD